MSNQITVLDPHTRQPALAIAFVGKFAKAWSDNGSKADKSLTVWRPEVMAGYNRLGHFASPNYEAPQYPMIAVRALQPGATAPPVRYEQFWNDGGSGADLDGVFWTPIAPNGYKAMGTVVTSGPEPAHDEVVCIRQDLVARGSVGELVWGDWGAGSDRDCTLYDLLATTPQTDSKTTYISSGSFCGHSSYDKLPVSNLANCLAVELPTEKHDVNIPVPTLSSTARPPEESDKLLTAVTYMPCTLVKDPAYGGNLMAQITNDSFYKLERWTSYKLLSFAVNDGSGNGDKFTYSVAKGISKTESEKVTDSISIAISAGYGGGSTPGPNFQVTTTYSFALERGTAITESTMKTTSYEATVPVNGATGIFNRVDTYVLRRASDNGQIASWEVPGDVIQKINYDPALEAV